MTNRPELGYSSPAAGRTLDALAAKGVNAVSIMPFAFQRSATSNELSWRHTHPSAETDQEVRAGIRAARQRGLYVLLKPQVWVPRSWPGAIEPADPVAWWAAYREYVLHHAALAREEGADALCVGTELTRLQARAEWRPLIAEVRRAFPGLVVYAANWDATDVSFAADLDALGVDLYQPLAESAQASDGELRAGARRVVDGLDRLAARVGRPVLLTEVGFAARRACWSAPHLEGGEVDTSAQRRSTGALLAAMERSQRVAGLFWWKVFSDGRAAREDEPSFRLTGRPAEAELFAFFARMRRLAPPAMLPR